MAKSKLGALEPALFENDLPVSKPAQIDELYGPEYLAAREALAQRVSMAGRVKQIGPHSRFVESGEGLVIEPPARKQIPRYRPSSK